MSSGQSRSMSSGAVRAGISRFHDRRDSDFVLHEMVGVEPAEEITGIFAACESFVETWQHADAILDRSPPQMIPAAESVDGRNMVKSHPITSEVVDAMREQGVAELSQLGLPFSVQCTASVMVASGFSSNLPGLFVLTRCAADLLEAHGSDDLKSRYLGQLRSGEYFGTMALSEPHAGSSLATIRTSATPQPGQPGEYRIRGDKMWTTGAFHDLSDNIIHMLLARTPGAADGAAGISLFLVPNVLPDGTTNDVELVSLNKKMGHRAITNCAWTLGDRGGGAVGYLVGREGRGLQCMFGMMNAMRIEVGLGAACLGKRGFFESLLYAQEREQGGCAIIEHDDVKRMLLAQKAYSEGAYAMCILAAGLHDKAAGGDAQAAALLDVQTEIVKSWPSEWCLEANKWAIQVLGGAGYVQDYPVEQLYRDNRLNMIHEGTHGIHAKTLLGRKVQGGRAAILFDEMKRTADEAAAYSSQLAGGASSAQCAAACLDECSGALQLAVTTAEQVTTALTSPQLDKGVALANAHEYLTLMGHTTVAWVWLQSALAAARGLERLDESAAEAADDERKFYLGKLHTCNYFFRHELPRTAQMAKLLLAEDVTVREMQTEWF